MGLDAVEMVMAVEDHFGIFIQTAEAGGIRTVGDLVMLIQARIEAAHVTQCATFSAFMRLRSATREIVADDRMRIRTATRIADVLTPSQRRRLWKRLSEILGVPPPALRRPPALHKLMFGFVIVAFAITVVYASMIDVAKLPLGLGLTALTAVALHFATLGFRTFPPVDLSTFGAVAKRIGRAEIATERLHLRSFDAVLAELRPLIVKTLGVDAEEVVASARFIEDLGLD